MQIDNYQFLSYQDINQLYQVFEKWDKSTNKEPYDKHGANYDPFFKVLTIQEQWQQLTEIKERLNKSDLADDEKSLILTGGLILLDDSRGTHVPHQAVCDTIIGSDKLFEHLKAISFFSHRAKTAAIDSFRLYKNSQDYIPYASRLAAKRTHTTDILFGEAPSLIKSLGTRLLTDSTIDGIDTNLQIEFFKFHSYRSLFESYQVVVHLRNILFQKIANNEEIDISNMLLLLPRMLAHFDAMEKVFTSLEESTLPEEDKSLIATGALFTLSFIREKVGDFLLGPYECYVNGESLLYCGIAAETAKKHF